MRPLSPGGRSLMRSALDAAGEAVHALSMAAIGCGDVAEALSGPRDSMALRCAEQLQLSMYSASGCSLLFNGWCSARAQPAATNTYAPAIAAAAAAEAARAAVATICRAPCLDPPPQGQGAQPAGCLCDAACARGAAAVGGVRRDVGQGGQCSGRGAGGGGARGQGALLGSGQASLPAANTRIGCVLRQAAAAAQIQPLPRTG